jgi:uncharacterized RDD family membrane protein YckC
MSGEIYGPVELPELREWVRENRAGLGTTVRLDEPEALWQPWQYYPELVALLAEAQIPSAVPGQPALVIAPMSRRFIAFILDLILSYLLLFPIAFVVFVLFLPDTFVQMAVAFIQIAFGLGQYPVVEVPMIYHVFIWTLITLYKGGFEFAHGKTPGKALTRLRVEDENGGKPGATKALIRGLIFSFSLGLLLPLFYVFFNPQRRAIHDLLAGTYVVES